MTSVIKNTIQRLTKTSFMVLGLGLAVGALGGCSTSSTLSSLGSALGGGSSDNNSAQTTAPVQQVSVKQTPPIQFAPVFGPPRKIANQLSGALQSEAQVRSIKVTKGAGAQYTVRGYLSASPSQGGTKLTYIWDVMDPSGKRAHRINGAEIVQGGKNSKDPWSGINQAAIQSIAAKTTTQLASWLPGGGAPARSLVQQASLRNTGAIPGRSSGPVIAVVPKVKGAPGDGSSSLAAALRQQLSSKGIKVGSVGSVSNPYKVQGYVSLTKAGGNQQKISIDWKIKGPRNEDIGTVSQRNTIPAGSLDGAWGNIANAAASAAAKGIANLIKEKSGS